MEQLGKQNLGNTMHQRVQAVIARTKKFGEKAGQQPSKGKDFSSSAQKDSYALSCQNLWSFSMRRTSQQNACMWTLLGDISHQLNWQGMHLSKSEWKNWFVAYLGQLNHVSQSKDHSTSHMSVEQMRQLIGFIVHFGLIHGVEFNLCAADKSLYQSARLASL